MQQQQQQRQRTPPLSSSDEGPELTPMVASFLPSQIVPLSQLCGKKRSSDEQAAPAFLYVKFRPCLTRRQVMMRHHFQCDWCGVTSTPEMRPGPGGKKNALCNSCVEEGPVVGADLSTPQMWSQVLSRAERGQEASSTLKGEDVNIVPHLAAGGPRIRVTESTSMSCRCHN